MRETCDQVFLPPDPADHRERLPSPAPERRDRVRAESPKLEDDGLDAYDKTLADSFPASDPPAMP